MSDCEKENYEKVIKDAKRVVAEFLEQAKLKEGNLVVIGCSTSEIAEHQIGSYSNAELGEAVFVAMYEEFEKAGLSVAAQCCEHLNRALIMSEADAECFGCEIVNVIPQPKAGGSFSTAAWKHMEHPVAVEHIQAHAGIDIGDTLIGMHLRPVAVPVRIEHPVIGGAHIVCARTRAKYIGGGRACYNEDLE
ncbi:MAG: TIGR01440 family protein [Lachnospiraceae bacterium]|nr:TIGR01440 family protein [Lachnospiraceae bacterium]MDE7201338.1 TIGR01440 family protein [Lachnospiraceae bacterium]